MIANVVIRAGESTPKDIILYEPEQWILAFPKGTQETDIILGTSIVMGGPQVESKLMRWTGTGWVSVGTIVVYN